jgi:hypothetical protein
VIEHGRRNVFVCDAQPSKTSVTGGPGLDGIEEAPCGRRGGDGDLMDFDSVKRFEEE